MAGIAGVGNGFLSLLDGDLPPSVLLHYFHYLKFYHGSKPNIMSRHDFLISLHFLSPTLKLMQLQYSVDEQRCDL